ncbi:MAG: MraY family glycosyltransferase, partial [Eubacteriales bacterium]
AGALFLGYTLATLSILGLFKWYSFVSFGIPFLILGIPIFDIFFSVIRRILHGKNPMKADRGHVHQQLIDLGLNQKQVVAIFYCLSATLGLVSVLISGQNLFRQIIAIIIAVSALLLSLFLFLHREKTRRKKRLEEQAENEESGSSPEDRG